MYGRLKNHAPHAPKKKSSQTEVDFFSSQPSLSAATVPPHRHGQEKKPPKSPSPATTLRPPKNPLFNRRSLFLLLKIRCLHSMQPLCLFCQALLLETQTVKSRHPRPCLQSLMFNKVRSRTRIPQFLKP